MFSRVLTSALIASSIALLAVATPWDTTSATPTPTVTKTITVTAPATTPTSVSTCSTGDAQCCSSVVPADSDQGSALLGLLGIVVEGVDVLLGVDCSAITVVGVGSSGSCSGEVVCCEDNSVGDLISIGCIPIIL